MLATIMFSASSDEFQSRKSRRRRPPEATPDYLRRWALRYLDRYDCSAAHLRRLMLNKVETSARHHDTDRTAGRAAVDALITSLVEQGLLNDTAFAAARARALFLRGVSGRAIRARLASKGVAQEAINEALASLTDQSPEPDLAAALRYARKRRLGPYRTADERAQERLRDLAALDRRGFGYDVALRVIDCDDLEELEQEAGIAGL